MVELQARQQVVLLAGGIEGDAIGPGHRAARQMARPQANHPLLAGAWQQVDVHHSWRAGHRGLATELGGGGWSETEALAPGHGGREHGPSSLAGEIRAAGTGLLKMVPLATPQDPAAGSPEVPPPLEGAVGAAAPPTGGAVLGTNPSPLCTAETTPRPFTVCCPPITNPVELPPSRLRASRNPAARNT